MSTLQMSLILDRAADERPREPLLSRLKEFRKLAGFSQSSLASAVGVSRQAIIAIEGGRQIPSTLLSLQLARALGCRVDELFVLPDPSSLDVTLAPPLPPACAGASERVAVGHVAGRWVAHPLADDAGGAADGLIVTAEAGATGPSIRVQPLQPPDALACNALVAGCAPLLGCLAARLTRRGRAARATWLPANSTHALQRLASRELHVAGLHFRATREDHRAIIAERFSSERMLLIHLIQWRQGLLVPKGNPLGIAGSDDLLRPGLRVARREPGSGAEALLRRLLGSAGKTLGGPAALSHRAVAELVHWGVADVGVAIENAAIQAGLEFVPLAEERFDLVLTEASAREAAVVPLLDELHAGAFRREVAGLPGYDASLLGQCETVEAAA